MHPAQALRRLIAATVSLLGALALAQSPARISFAHLPKGDSLHIAYSAAGCFSWEAADFIYTSAGGGMFDVTEIVFDYKTRERARMPRGRVFLDPGEPAKLDALLDLYRATPPKDMLTLIGPAIPSLHIEQRRGFRVIATEKLHDKQIPPHTPVLTFETMLDALRRHAAQP